MRKHISIAILLLAAALLPAAPGDPDPKTLDKKVLFGYQGWFNCAGDGAPENNWRSWARGVPGPDTLTVDMYPDLSEFDKDELCAVSGLTIAGKPAYLYSAWNPKVVARHFRWMKEYGLDGVLVQRFVTTIARKRASGDVVLKNILAGAAATGRIVAIEYDVTGSNVATFVDVMREDWKYLVDELKITSHPGYLHHNGKPVLSVWGPGLHEDRHVPHDPNVAKEMIEWFRSQAPAKYQVTYMGGTPSRWRSLTNDARPEPGWADAYRMMDVVQPWIVGRYRDAAGVDRWKDDMIVPDLALAAQNKQMYMPVIFPGFSWNNLKRDAPKNAIPRNRGEFLWRQAYNAKVSGATVLKIAMFDEVNEGTAMFKLAARRQDAPDQGYWLTLDADDAALPSDWYLRLAGEITRMFHGETPADPKLPEKPGPPWKAPTPATLASERDDGSLAHGRLQIQPVAPGVFPAAGGGSGPPAALVRVEQPDGTVTTASVAVNDGEGVCQAAAIDLGPPGSVAVLELYGTGGRGRSSLEAVACSIGGESAPVLLAEPDRDRPGLDHVHVALPRSLAGSGLATIRLSVDGVEANSTQVSFR